MIRVYCLGVDDLNRRSNTLGSTGWHEPVVITVNRVQDAAEAYARNLPDGTYTLALVNETNELRLMRVTKPHPPKEVPPVLIEDTWQLSPCRFGG